MFSKLWLWALEAHYDTVIYIDSDMLMVGDPTPLMRERGPLQMVPDRGSMGVFNAGLIVLTPNVTLFGLMVDAMGRDKAHHEQAEQNFLNEYMKGAIGALSLNFTGEVGSTPDSINDDTVDAHRAILLHFIGENKPWNQDNCDRSNMHRVCAIWTQTPLNGCGDGNRSMLQQQASS
jgi:lipopolysaccharide biosynthesis glycosyltransferase